MTFTSRLCGTKLLESKYIRCTFPHSMSNTLMLIYIIILNLISSDNRDDQYPRVCALAFLCRLNPSNHLHQRLMEELVQRLLRKVCVQFLTTALTGNWVFNF